jgi:2-polyprenyl-3-methyl-5-hydroxy-6-metoxy-1,4-benzoquinol methylase
MSDLTDRQQRELDYHRQRAREHEDILAKPLPRDVLRNSGRRWWNAYWQLYSRLIQLDLKGKRVLVVGCGFGQDAIRIALLGARVYGFDLSPESIDLARKLAAREGVAVDLDVMPSERMAYPDDFFDCVVAVDILHHVDIPKTMAEIRRVAKSGARFVMDEIYSHSWTERVRRSWLIERVVYRPMQRVIYGPGKPYITADERKLTEGDVEEIAKVVRFTGRRHFNALVGRLVPDYDFPAKVDRMLLSAVEPIGPLLAGRILYDGEVMNY